MLGAAVGDAGGGPDHEGDGVTEHERDLGRLIGDLVHGPESKVDEIQVDDGVHPGHRRSDPGGHHRRLRYGGVEDPARPDHLRQALDLAQCPPRCTRSVPITNMSGLVAISSATAEANPAE